MAVQLTQYSVEELARRGQEIYERDIRPQVEPDNVGKIVAIDVISGDFEMAEDVLTCARRLRIRKPEAEVWLVRIGHRALHNIRLAKEQI